MTFRTTCLIAVSVLVVLRVAPGSKYLLNSTRYLMNTEKRPVIYTYTDETKAEEEEMLKVWKEKWYDAGWDPVVLTMEHAKSHRAYEAVLDVLPIGGGDQAFHWLSVAQAGGGWFSEHDVFPLHDFTHDDLPNGGTLTLWENVVPSLISGSSAEFARGAHVLAETVQGDSKHSDILALVQLSRSSPFGQSFLKERKVISGNRAIESNGTICFDGKYAVHFADYKLEDMKSVVNWLDEWAESDCSDLPKGAMKTKQEGKKISSSLKNQQLSTLIHERDGMQQVISHGSARGSAQAHPKQPHQQVPQVTAFDKDILIPEVQSQISQRRQLPAPHSGAQLLSADQQKVPPLVQTTPQKQVPMQLHATTATEAHVQSAAQTARTLQQKQEPTQNHQVLPAEEQRRYPRNKFPEARGEPENGAGYITNSQHDALLSPGDQARFLRTRGLLPSLEISGFEWSEMLRVASIDENLVNQLARGDRRAARQVSFHHDASLSSKIVQQQGGNHQTLGVKEVVGQSDDTQRAPHAGGYS